MPSSREEPMSKIPEFDPEVVTQICEAAFEKMMANWSKSTQDMMRAEPEFKKKLAMKAKFHEPMVRETLIVLVEMGIIEIPTS